MKHLTFDIDWAPDWSVEETLNILDENSVKATFFATHKSKILSKIYDRGHNLGIHPNFYPNSDQGNNPTDAVSFLLKLVPKAHSVRTHGLYQAGNIFLDIFTKFPQLKYDFSTLMYKFPHIGKFPWLFEGTEFLRLNYNWEDDCAFFDKNFSWSSLPTFSDDIIFDFHPIHISLNSSNLKQYKLLKKSIGKVKLNTISKNECGNFVNSGYGSKSFLKLLPNEFEDFVGFEELLCELD